VLKEIFEKIVAETESYLLLKGLSVKVNLGEPSPAQAGNRVYIAMEDYGIDPLLKNHSPAPDDDAQRSPNYSHLLTFYILPVSPDYTMRLQLTELMVKLFEVRPFFQLVVGHDEYELSISMKSTTTTDYQQFWISRQQPSQPVVFYQARVSAL
jgi:hypothetical protein